MTPVHSAARADQQPRWAGRSWTSNVRDAAGSQGSAWQSTGAILLHTSVRSLLAGWKWFERKRAQHVSSRRMRLTETISLGEKRSVSIIEVDGAQYLIGSSAGSVQLLTVLDKQDGGDLRRSEARAS